MPLNIMLSLSCIADVKRKDHTNASIDYRKWDLSRIMDHYGMALQDIKKNNNGTNGFLVF